MSEEAISHNQALDMIEEHLGERVYFGFNPLEPRPPRLEPDQGFYAIGHGGDSYHLPPMAGTVHLRDNGIDFRVAETALIRVAWRGSSEVGDWRPTREDLEKLNSIGVRLPEHEKPGVTLPTEADE